MDQKKFMVYPIYFDKERTISEGRRVPSSLACSNPRITSLASAATKAGLHSSIEEKHHPKDDARSKRLIIISDKSKNEILKLLAQELVALSNPAPTKNSKK